MFAIARTLANPEVTICSRSVGLLYRVGHPVPGSDCARYNAFYSPHNLCIGTTMTIKLILPVAIAAALGLSALTACERTVVTPPTTTVVPVAVPVAVPGPAGAPGAPGADGAAGKPGNTVVIIPPPLDPAKDPPRKN